MSQPIILYDIANTLNKEATVSRHVWRTRLNLAYKHVPYETVWVEFGDIQQFAKDIGAVATEKNPDGTDRYTFPIIRVRETGQVISDSVNIAKYLDEKYPDRPLIPAGTEEQQSAFANSIMGLVGMNVMIIPFYGVWANLTAKGKSGLERRAGVPFAEKTWPTDAQLDVFEPALNRVAEAYDKIERAGNDNLIFADLVVVGYLKSFQGGVNAEQFERILALNGGKWKKLLDKVEKETAVDA